MCGRFALAVDLKTLIEAFGIKLDGAQAVDVSPRYNIAPSTQILGVCADENSDRRLREFRWGLIPHWAKDPTIGYKMINARAETAAEKPSFRSAIRSRRCLIPASAFYEWKTINKEKIPYCIRPQQSSLMAFAGIWENWRGPDVVIQSCSILTTVADDIIRPIHPRMPVILAPQDYSQWLDSGAQGAEAMQALLKANSDFPLEVFEVDRRVNSPKNEGPECWTPTLTPAGGTSHIL